MHNVHYIVYVGLHEVVDAGLLLDISGKKSIKHVQMDAEPISFGAKTGRYEGV
jgi:hypothetical protein